MDSIINNRRLEQKDLINNPAPRLPLCICVDTSYTMLINSRIKQVNEGIRKFISDIHNDYYAIDMVELCIISFGGDKARIEQEFKTVDYIHFNDMKANGRTPIGSAVMLALDAIEKRKENYDSHGITSYKPWIVIISDGAATDDFTMASSRLLALQRSNRVKVTCIGIGDEDNALAHFEINKKVSQLRDFQLNKVFSWLSKSMTLTSQQSNVESYEAPSFDATNEV